MFLRHTSIKKIKISCETCKSHEQQGQICWGFVVSSLLCGPFLQSLAITRGEGRRWWRKERSEIYVHRYI